VEDKVGCHKGSGCVLAEGCEGPVNGKFKSKVKGSGQECPLHTSSAAEAGSFLTDYGAAEAAPLQNILLL
jgi:hypothetical protein